MHMRVFARLITAILSLCVPPLLIPIFYTKPHSFFGGTNGSLEGKTNLLYSHVTMLGGTRRRANSPVEWAPEPNKVGFQASWTLFLLTDLIVSASLLVAWLFVAFFSRYYESSSKAPGPAYISRDSFSVGQLQFNP